MNSRGWDPLRTPRFYQRERPPPLYHKFLDYLTENNIKEFPTKLCYDWYKLNKTGKRYADYSAIYPLILNPLKYQGFIKKSFKGIWEVLPEEKQPIKAKPEKEKPISKKDQEFFDYIDSKIRGDEK